MEPAAVGSLINDRYELIECFSRTYMSSVFKAWDHQKQRFVAVKISTNIINLIERLHCEGQALQRLDHPRIVRIFDCGYFGEAYFLVLEYLQGKDIGACLKVIGHLPLDVAICVGIEMLAGLDAVHNVGIIHRDIKPGNVMVTSSGVKLIDFGLVKFISGTYGFRRRLTLPGRVMGTLPYVSPEQACGSNEVDCRSDIFACGVLLFKILTGAYPFYQFNNLNEERSVYWQRPIGSFAEAAPSIFVPREVQEIVWKALAVNPSDRYQTAAEMRSALLAVQPSVFPQFLEEVEIHENISSSILDARTVTESSVGS